MTAAPGWRLALMIGGALTVIAWLSPTPGRVTDRGVYEATAAAGVGPDCADLHCFRVLVPWILGRLPGQSETKWKAYAVVANTAAALGVRQLAGALGLTPSAGLLAAMLAACGFGSLYTLHDPFTADPLMFALGPIITLFVIRERLLAATLLGATGVLAKEFAAAPLYIGALWALFRRRGHLAARALAAGNTAFLVWLVLQFTLMLRYNYGYGDNPSTHLMSGGYLRPWFAQQSTLGAAAALFNVYGAAYLLAPVGYVLAPQRLRDLALSALPVALLFSYVQQPDRALWNVHFVLLPLAACVLARAPHLMAWGVVAAMAAVNLRVGAQLAMVPDARVGHLVALLLAISAVVYAATHRRLGDAATESTPKVSGAVL